MIPPENITPQTIRELYMQECGELIAETHTAEDIADIIEDIATFILSDYPLTPKKREWSAYWGWFEENTELIKIEYYLCCDDYPDHELSIDKEYYKKFSDAILADTLGAPSDFFNLPNVTSGDWDVWDWSSDFYISANRELLQTNLFYKEQQKKAMMKAFTEQLEDKYRDAPLTHEIFSEDTIALHLWMKDLHSPLSVHTPKGFVMYKSIATTEVISYLFKYIY